MARPIQLRYDDFDNGETIIGTYLKRDGFIEQAEMKNSGSGEYTRLEIKGSRQLKDNLPIDYTKYATDEPEILVYTLNQDGDWQLRDRVFAEDAGMIDDNGDYRNENLFGFQKWVGRKKTSNRISLSNVTITEIVNEILPNGYIAETPSDDTVPTLDNYSFNGKIDRAIRDLIRDFPVKIWWTPETDGNGNYIVKIQSKGYGDVVQTIDYRTTQSYQIVRFEEEDKSNVVNKVEIEGVDNSGNTVQVVKDDPISINENGERYIHRNVGYLESETQAENIANNILNPDSGPHAEMTIPFQNNNILNASIDIFDERYGIDAVYTVVKQRDFYTEGRTQVELGFEKNRSEERRDRDRELDERNHQLFPTSATQENVGEQDFSADTGSAPSDTATTGAVDSDPSDTATTGGVNDAPSDTNTVGSVQNEGTADIDSSSTSSDFFNTSINSNGWTNIASFSIDVDALALELILNFDISSTSNIDIAIIEQQPDGAESVVLHDPAENIGNNDSYDLTGQSGENHYTKRIYTSNPATIGGGNFTYFLRMASKGGDTPTVDGIFQGFTINHSHPDDIDTNDNNHPHGDDIDTDDFNHPHGDDIDTDDFSHGGTVDATGQHGASGTTDPKTVDIEAAKEDKTDR